MMMACLCRSLLRLSDLVVVVVVVEGVVVDDDVDGDDRLWLCPFFSIFYAYLNVKNILNFTQ